jgi:hypothetical protein
MLPIRHSQDGIDASLMAANSNTQVPSLSLIRAFGFRRLNFLDNGPDFCKPNFDHRSRQTHIHARPARRLPKRTNSRSPRGRTREMKADVQQKSIHAP